MRTYDNRGRLLGDSTLTPDFQSMVNDASAPAAPADDSTMLAPITVTASPLSFTWTQLFQPPFIYLLAAGAVFLAFTYSKKRPHR